MNKWINRLLQREVTQYLMPTVAGDGLEFEIPSEASFEGAPQFHEDEWSQVEFLPGSRLAEVKTLLQTYKGFEQEHRIRQGWDAVYVRELTRSVVLGGEHAPRHLAELFGAQAGNAPILLTRSVPLGQVQGGFSVSISSDVTLYGLADAQGINLLGAMVRAGGDDQQLVHAFMQLHSAEGLLLVDWRGQLVLSAIKADGKIEGWRP